MTPATAPWGRDIHRDPGARRAAALRRRAHALTRSFLMVVPAPAHCRPAAYQLFAATLPHLDSTEGLVAAATALSMHELENATPADVEHSLQRMADTVRGRLSSGNESALLAHVHHHLFEELGFRGNTTDYYNAANSYLPVVLETRTGLPITLALVYKVVMEKLGARVIGINAPGHFLARVELASGPMLVDTFAGGQVLTFDEACERSAQAIQQPLPLTAASLPVATHRQWIGRMLRNLYTVFLRTERPEDLSAIVELCRLLNADSGVA
jgi:regulator of sirC expression with transglutaminase-like and TPR domain